MEEAIGKFMEGMEKQERTGYSALHKLLQGLPVPVHNTAGSMTQAEAFVGGFLCDLDEDEKKRFTPSERLLYKVAVEYRYITVHTGTYLYVLVHTGTYLYILTNFFFFQRNDRFLQRTDNYFQKARKQQQFSED
jgi:hypothetical protein